MIKTRLLRSILLFSLSLVSTGAYANQDSPMDFYVTRGDLMQYNLKKGVVEKSRTLDENALKEKAVDALLKAIEKCAAGEGDKIACAKEAMQKSDLDISENTAIGEWETKILRNPKTRPPSQKGRN